MSQTLANHVAIISGGIGDIGSAIARALAARGASVGISDIRPPAEAQALLRQLAERGAKCRYDPVDVSDASAVARWIDAAAADLGAADLIIPNAAQVTIADIRKVTPEQWRREIAVNLDGA